MLYANLVFGFERLFDCYSVSFGLNGERLAGSLRCLNGRSLVSCLSYRHLSCLRQLNLTFVSGQLRVGFGFKRRYF